MSYYVVLVLVAVAAIAAAMVRRVGDHPQRWNAAFWVLVAAQLLMLGFAGHVHYQTESERKSADRQLRQVSKQLETAELSADDQRVELRSANRKLDNAEQVLKQQSEDLRSANQRLRQAELSANDQRVELRSANRKLDDAERVLKQQSEDLRSANQRLRQAEHDAQRSKEQQELLTQRLTEVSKKLGGIVAAEESSIVFQLHKIGGRILDVEDGFVTSVSLAGTTADDHDLEHLTLLRRLRSLDLRQTQITDAASEHLQKLAGLEVLFLNDTKISTLGWAERAYNLKHLELDYTPIPNDELRHLSRLKKLEVLSLYAMPRVTDAGFAHLAGLMTLKKLDLACKTNGSGLTQLRALANLEQLSLHASHVSEEYVGLVCQFPKLETLWLGYAEIGDEGIEKLRPLVKLRSLFIEHTGITDRSLSTLAEFPSLSQLSLRETKVSGAAIAELKRSRPGIYISQ